MEVTGGQGGLHNKELHNLYTSPNIVWKIIKKNQMGRAFSMHGETRSQCKISIRMPHGKG
jgi:hypothetical protein